jgi:glycosyltransferase involved in cell wall biosynthesis
VGGVETYLNTVIPQLSKLGHSLAFLHEVDEPANRERIDFPDDLPVWCVAELGSAAALKTLRAWQPDLIYSHGLLQPKLEAATIKIAPAIFFAHNYYGTCISGTKTFQNPIVKPCDRRFGVMCLAHYFPHRCGGLNPVTMLKLYRRQAGRLELLRDCDAIVTASEHMRAEYIQHGIDPEHIHNFPYYVGGAQQSVPPIEVLPQLVDIGNGSAIAPSERSSRREWRLLLLGRMDSLKGGSVFLDALPQISAALQQPLRVIFGGDGPERQFWERKAKGVQARQPGVCIEFTGWLRGAQLDSLITGCDLLVLPSLWPEPFGLVGPEAGLYGVPVAAFNVGGVREWLIDGVNGHLAPGNPPTASGIAEAVVKCLRDLESHNRLRVGAVQMARKFNLTNHLTALIEIFEKVLSQNNRSTRENSASSEAGSVATLTQPA